MHCKPTEEGLPAMSLALVRWHRRRQNRTLRLVCFRLSASCFQREATVGRLPHPKLLPTLRNRSDFHRASGGSHQTSDG